MRRICCLLLEETKQLHVVRVGKHGWGIVERQYTTDNEKCHRLYTTQISLRSCGRVAAYSSSAAASAIFGSTPCGSIAAAMTFLVYCCELSDAAHTCVHSDKQYCLLRKPSLKIMRSLRNESGPRPGAPVAEHQHCTEFPWLYVVVWCSSILIEEAVASLART